MPAKRCPICNQGMLGFVTHPSIRDNQIIRVMATCTDCHYVFFHHFFFEEMLTEVYATDESDDSNTHQPKKKTHLTLVKSTDKPLAPALPTKKP